MNKTNYEKQTDKLYLDKAWYQFLDRELSRYEQPKELSPYTKKLKYLFFSPESYQDVVKWGSAEYHIWNNAYAYDNRMKPN